MKTKQNVGGALQKFSSVLILVVLVVIMATANGNFFSGSNFINILRQSATLGIMAVGETLVILLAGIDLSVGNVMAICGCSMAVASAQLNLPPGVAILLGVLLGIILGILNGVIITKGKIQPFIATLGMMTACQGGALLITDGLPISGMPDSMLTVGSGTFIGIPVSIILWLVVVIFGWILLNRFRFGRNIMAIGGNVDASRASGIRTDFIQIVTYGISGLCCALSSLVLIGRLNSASGLMGGGYELNCVTAVALGGTSLAGGKGGIVGTLIGTITIGVLNNGLDLMNVTSFWQDVILGVMIILVVMLDSFRSRRFKD